MATRCCWPPESWWMLRRSKPFRPTSSSISRTFGRTLFLRQLLQRAGRTPHFQRRSDAGKARTSGTPCLPGACRVAGQSMSSPSKKTLPDFGVINPADHAQSGRFAAAGRAKERNELLVVNVQGQARPGPFCPSKSTTMSFSDTMRFSFIHYCIPLCGISRYSTFFSHRFFLRPAQST